jgi:transcriptional regulator with XRE-family HTH domain
MAAKNTNALIKVGANIKKLRNLRNYTQVKMAEILKITQAAYSKIEKDETDIALKRLVQIAEILEVKLADIFKFDEKLGFNSPENQGDATEVVTNQETQIIELYERLLASKEQQILELKEIITLLKAKNNGLF